MKSIIALGKKQITELLTAYNKGVKSTFGLQKSYHQFAQAIGYKNWFDLEPLLEDSASSMLSSDLKKEFHRLTDQYLAFSVRFPSGKDEAAEAFLKFLLNDFPSYLHSQHIPFPELDAETLQKTFLEKLMDGYSERDRLNAPRFFEVIEWYDVAASITEEDVYTYAFHYSGWDDALAKKAIYEVIRPAFYYFCSKLGDGEFLSAEIGREFRYGTKTPI